MKIRIGRGFLFAVVVLSAIELSIHLFFKDKSAGVSSFGFDSDSGFVDRRDGMVEFQRTWGRRFHVQETTSSPSHEVARIFVVGDSVPRGKSPGRAYSGRIVPLMAEAGFKAESFNLALPGYGARRVQIVIERGLRYKPDVVIFHLNNSNEYEDERDYERYRESQSWHPRNWIKKSYFFQKLHQQRTEKLMWRYLPPDIRDLNGGDDAGSERAASANEVNLQRWRELVEAESKESVKILKDAGVCVILVSQCRYRRENQENNRLVRNDFLEDLAKSLEGKGVHHFSMYDAFASVDPEPHFADSAHLRDTGHQIVAEELARFIPARLIQFEAGRFFGE
ncbi:MAG: SGNH/GDSL hydrolase family protein [Verrucomicrobiales bacterium]